jgi:arylsulfatase
LIEGRSEFTYYPRAVRIPESSAPNVKNKSHAIPAFVEMRKKAATECWWRPAGSWADTPLHQGSNAGIRIQLVFAKAISSRKLAAATLGTGHDPSRVRVRWRRRRQGRHHNADRERSKSRRRRVEKTVPARYSADETFDIGMDTGTPVSDDYASLNRFTGVMEKVEITLGVSGLSEEDEKNVKAMERAAAVAAH